VGSKGEGCRRPAFRVAAVVRQPIRKSIRSHRCDKHSPARPTNCNVARHVRKNSAATSGSSGNSVWCECRLFTELGWHVADSCLAKHARRLVNVVRQLFYDLNGNMSAHMMRVNRPMFASDDSGLGADAEVRAAFEGHTSYFGRDTIDPSARTVTHHVRGASYPNWIGHDQIRYYRIDGSHLVLSTPPIPYRGESLKYILTWERTK
jgi:hypothetical protein